MSENLETDRRRFLQVVGATGAAASTAVLNGGELAAAENPPPTGNTWRRLNRITIDDVLPHVRQRFRVYDSSNQRIASLLLIEVKPHEQEADSPFRVPFSMLFKIRRGETLASKTHWIGHRNLRRTHLMLSAVGPEGIYYEACFS